MRRDTKTIDTAELILALCEAGEWDLAVKFAKEKAAEQQSDEGKA